MVNTAVTTVVSFATTGKPPSLGQVAQAAVSGAVSGAVVGVLGPGAGLASAIGIGALSGAAGGVAGQLAYNAVTGNKLGNGLLGAGLEGALAGAATAGLFKMASPLLGKIGGALGRGLRTIAGKWFSLSDLDNTSNFAPNALKHIFEGDLRGGRAGGYHYEGMPDTPGSTIPGTETPPNAAGVYQAQVSVNGVPKVTNGGYSTFFPEWMSPQGVIDAINEAYAGRTFVTGNTYNGPTSAGFNITMYLNRMNRIISAFPDY